MAKTRSLIVNLIALVAVVMFSACSKDSTFFGGEEEKKQPLDPETEVIEVDVEPNDSLHVNLVDNNGVPVVRFVYWPGFAKIILQPTQYADAKEPWEPAEQLIREQLPQQAETTFRFNHGFNTVKTSVRFVVAESKVYDLGDGRKVVLTKGQELKLYKPERLNLKGGDPIIEVKEGKLFYAETKEPYALRYDERVLAEDVQPFVAQEGYVPAVIGNKMLDHSHINGWAGKLNGNKLPIYCNNKQLFAKMWDNGLMSDSAWVEYPCLNPFILDLHEVKTDDFATMQKVYTLNANGETTINGVKQRVVREADASVVGSVEYNAVEYKDSVHVCWYDAKTITLVSTDSADILFKNREGFDQVVERVGFKTIEVKVKDVLYEFIHTAFPSTGTVNGKNINIHHQDNGIFQPLFTDGSKGDKKTVKYPVDHNCKYSLPASVPLSYKGRTIDFKIDGNVATAEVLVLTSLSRTVGDIMYNNVNYKDKENVNCYPTAKTAFFGDTTIIITFMHDKETTTVEVPVPYEPEPTLKEIVRSFVHGKFNPTGEVTGYTIKLTCSNPAHFYKLFTDGSKKDEKTFDFYEYNFFNYSMEEIPLAAKGHTYYFYGNTANVIGKIVTADPASPQVVIGDIMYDGQNYKNDPKVKKCIANTYSISFGETTAIFTFMHDAETMTVEVPVPYEAEPYSPFEGVILCGSTTDQYADHVANLTGTDDHVLTKVTENDYRHYWRPMGSKNWSSESLTSIGTLTGKNLAWWYESDKTTRHLGAVKAYPRDNETDKWLLEYSNMEGEVQYYLGKAEETLNSSFRYPVQRTLQKVEKGGKTLWTFDNVEFFESK